MSDDDVRPGRGPGVPGAMHLEAFGQNIKQAFGHVPYHVGSSATSKTWRDVDVRLILPDDDFDALFPGFKTAHHVDAWWSLLCAAISELGRVRTGLPIDFQIQSMTEANEKYPGFRNPLLLIRPEEDRAPVMRTQPGQPADPVSGEQRDGAADGVRAFLPYFREDPDDTVIEAIDTTKPLTVGMLRAVLAERDALATRVAELESEREADVRWSETAAELLAAIVAPACETDRYGNCATHGVLVLEEGSQCPHVLGRAFLSSSRLHLKTQQPAPVLAEHPAGDGEAEREAVEAAERFATAWGYGNDVVRETADYTITIGTRDGGEASMSALQLLAVLDRLRRLERERAGIDEGVRLVDGAIKVVARVQNREIPLRALDFVRSGLSAHFADRIAALDANAAPDGRSATETGEEGVRESVEGNTGSILPQGLSEPEGGHVTATWCWAPNPNGPLRCGRPRNHDGPHQRGERTWTNDDTTEG
jgi:hypothetical protein